MRVCAALFSLALLSITSAASAHVTVSSPDAQAGGFGKLVFRVPTESATAATTKVTVTLPANTPFAFVSSQAKPGWKTEYVETKHAKPVKIGDFEVSKTVSAVSWTATGVGIKPGEFDEFALSVGPIPKSKDLTFTAQQHYSDDTTVNWDQIPSGRADVDHPAPTLRLATSVGPPQVAKATDLTSRGLAIAALGIAAAGYLLGLRNNRRHA
jgi:uncharacterized protein YcnI